MTPADFSAALKQLGLTQQGAAEALKLSGGQSTIWRMASGKNKRGIPGPVEIALTNMIALQEALAEIERLRDRLRLS